MPDGPATGLPAEVADGLAAAAGVPVSRARRLAGGDICTAYAVDVDTPSGPGAPGPRTVFVKHLPGAPAGFFAAEARGLAWLAEADAAPLPGVLAAGPTYLALDWVPPGRPSPAAAEQLGRDLARLHQTGAESFGVADPSFIGSLPVRSGEAATWAELYGERLLHPMARAAASRGGLPAAGVALIERLVERLTDLVPAEPPARLHGDLWSGNVLWGADDRAWLVDPSAYAGHRETDLAMLALFGAPHLDRILAAYQEVHPLEPGWAGRVALHQVWPLLVHARLFGGGYGARALAAASAYLG